MVRLLVWVVARSGCDGRVFVRCRLWLFDPSRLVYSSLGNIHDGQNSGPWREMAVGKRRSVGGRG